MTKQKRITMNTMVAGDISHVESTFFGSFNPFAELIAGDWFHANNRSHHAGAVYLNGHWLTEAVSLEEVLKPLTATPLWFASVDTTNTVIWLDTGALFLESNGNLNRDLIKDGLHPSTKGYYAWAEAMEPTIKKLMGE